MEEIEIVDDNKIKQEDRPKYCIITKKNENLKKIL
jgi:hypothetical protein